MGVPLGRHSSLLILLATLSGMCGAALASPPAGQGWRKFWQDNFDGNSLDSTKWSSGYPYGPLDGHQAFMSPDHVKVRDGHLLITATNSRHPDAPDTFTPEDGKTHKIDYTSGAVHNRGKFNIGYGYIEARMKLPSMRGAWPAFWLLRNDNDWPPEIDVVEMPVTRDFDLRKYHYTYHHGSSRLDHHQEGGSLIRGPNFSEGFHTFGTAWSRDYIEWYLDDQLVERIEGDFFDMANNMSLILNLGIGGWPGTPPPDAQWDAKMRVDWVRAYRRDAVPPPQSRPGFSPVPEPSGLLGMIGVASLLIWRRHV